MNKVKDLRKKHKITQAKLAHELNISRSAVAMYETGKCDPSNEILIELSRFFDVSTDYLLCQSDKKVPSTEEACMLPEIQELSKIMKKLSSEDRRRLLEFGQALVTTSHKSKLQK